MALITSTVENNFDDIFDDEGDLQKIHETEWKKMTEARIKESFADGRYLGEKSTVQNGFDHGYYEAFEIAQSISFIQGILAAVHLQTSDSVLKLRSREIKESLDVLKKDIIDFKLSCLIGNEPHDCNDEYLDLIDESINNCNSGENAKNNRGECYLSSLNADVFVKNADRLERVLADFEKVKKEIAQFKVDCKQPAVMDQISMSTYVVQN